MTGVTHEPTIGETFAGKFRIVGVLGEGGMGVVYEATHLFLGQRVAIKFLQPVLAQHQHIVARFVREARATSSISSEHVAKVLDVAVTESGTPYIVMELLPGADLAQLIRDRGRLPAGEAIDYVLQACEAIAEAHKLGIVHRDLKPANLFLTTRADGSALVKVFDFGISKSLSKKRALPSANATDPDAEVTATKTITKTGDVVGSPLYMSPEQFMDSKRVDERTDVWALGAILYEMLSGSPPFEGDDAVAVLARMVTMPPQPLREKCPELPARLEAVVLRCLEKDVNRRVDDIAELAEALEPFAPIGSRMSVRRIVTVLRGKPAPPERASASPETSPDEEPVATPPISMRPLATEPMFVPGVVKAHSRPVSIAERSSRASAASGARAPTPTEKQRSPAASPSALPGALVGALLGLLVVGADTVWEVLSNAPHGVEPRSLTSSSPSARAASSLTGTVSQDDAGAMDASNKNNAHAAPK